MRVRLEKLSLNSSKNNCWFPAARHEERNKTRNQEIQKTLTRIARMDANFQYLLVCANSRNSRQRFAFSKSVVALLPKRTLLRSAAVRSERQPQRVENATAREKTSGITVGVISAAGLGDTVVSPEKCQEAHRNCCARKFWLRWQRQIIFDSPIPCFGTRITTL